MKQLKVRILHNERIAQDLYRMRIESSYLAKNIKPGQFVQIRCAEELDPLLRRPFSVHRILKDGIEILYEVVGRGTEALARWKRDEYLDVVGPLGNGFDIDRTSYIVHRTSILVAGGMGVAPLVALAERLVDGSQLTVHRKKKKLHVFIGAKTKRDILCKEDFKRLGSEIMISTEDGSEGKKCLITDCLKSLLSTINYQLSTLYACGPSAMLKAVAKLARDKQIPCQVSLEEHMACGLGVCLGCPVKVKSRGYKMVCKDGPIFDAEEIAW